MVSDLRLHCTGDNDMNINLQSPYSDDDPGQEEPPFLAVGSLHDLDLCFVPVPELHEPQDPQDPHPPSTAPLELKKYLHKTMNNMTLVFLGKSSKNKKPKNTLSRIHF